MNLKTIAAQGGFVQGTVQTKVRRPLLKAAPVSCLLLSTCDAGLALTALHRAAAARGGRRARAARGVTRTHASGALAH